MENMFDRMHREELFQSFILQLDYRWDLTNPADSERVKQWQEIFDTAYKDVRSKRIGIDECTSYVLCRKFICKEW